MEDFPERLKKSSWDPVGDLRREKSIISCSESDPFIRGDPNIGLTIVGGEDLGDSIGPGDEVRDSLGDPLGDLDVTLPL